VISSSTSPIGLVIGADLGDRSGIVAEVIWEVDHAFSVPDTDPNRHVGRVLSRSGIADRAATDAYLDARNVPRTLCP
jgi:hypothetical protein